MKLFKKLCSMMLALSLIASSSAMVLAEDTADTEAETVSAEAADTVNYRKAAILAGLGIIDEDAAEGALVTRTEYSNAIVKMINDELPEGKAEADLTDSDGGMWWLKENGIIAGVGEGKYLPAGAVTVDQAIKIALDVLGYHDYIDTKGGYTEGYNAMAQNKKLLKGVSTRGSEPLDRASYINLLFNVIECDIMEIIYKEGEIKYKAGNEKRNLLSVYRNIFEAKGVVDADELTGLYSSTDAISQGRLSIDGVTMEASKIYEKDEDWLGVKVNYYYQETEDDYKILYIEEASSGEVVTINSGDFTAPYSNRTYTYLDENSRRKSVTLPNDIVVHYNGVYTPGNTVYNPDSGRVVLIDNDDDSDYDVLKVYDQTLVIVSKTQLQNDIFTIYDKFNQALNQKIRDYATARYRVYDANGNQVTTDSIVADTVISIEKSATKDPSYKIRVFNNTVDAIVQSQDTYSIYLDDGTEVEKTQRFKDLLASGDVKFEHNKAYKIYMTPQNRVVYMEEGVIAQEPLSYRVGFLLKAQNLDEYENGPRLRVFDESGIWKTFEMTEKVKFDKTRMPREDVDLSRSLGELIMYKLNIHGEIVEIITPKPIPNDTEMNASVTPKIDEDFQIILSGGAARKYYPGGYVVGAAYSDDMSKTYFSEGALLFIAPDLDPANIQEEQVRTAAMEQLGDGSSYDNIKAYTRSGTAGAVDLVLCKQGSSTILQKGSGDRPFCINKITISVNEDDEELYIVSGIQEGALVSVNVYDERTNTSSLPFEVGDVVYFLNDLGGDVVLRDDDGVAQAGEDKSFSFGKLLDYNKATGAVTKSTADVKDPKWAASHSSIDRAGNHNRMIMGKAYETTEKRISVSKNSANWYDWRFVEAFNCSSNYYIYLYDRDAEEYRVVANPLDAKTVKSAGSEASDVVVFEYNQFQLIIIYQ